VSNIEQSIVDLKESLEREIGVLKQDMHQGFSHLNDLLTPKPHGWSGMPVGGRLAPDSRRKTVSLRNFASG
jgi:hypothetical protein